MKEIHEYHNQHKNDANGILHEYDEHASEALRQKFSDSLREFVNVTGLDPDRSVSDEELDTEVVKGKLAAFLKPERPQSGQPDQK